MNRNPIAWFVATLIIGWIFQTFIEEGAFEIFVMFILAIILSKQIEILRKIDKN